MIPKPARTVTEEGGGPFHVAVSIESLDVIARGSVDARGCLGMDPAVTVGCPSRSRGTRSRVWPVLLGRTDAVARLRYDESYRAMPMRHRVDATDGALRPGSEVSYGWRYRGRWNTLRGGCGR